jgi:hypothetical protein
MLDIGRAMTLVPQRPQAVPAASSAAAAAAPVQAPAAAPAAVVAEAPSLNSRPIKVSRPAIVLGGYPQSDPDASSGAAAVTAKSLDPPPAGASPAAAGKLLLGPALSISQRFAGAFPLQNASLVFAPQHGGGWATCVTADVAAFPSNPAYGTDITPQLLQSGGGGYVVDLDPQRAFELAGVSVRRVEVRRDGSLRLEGAASAAEGSSAAGKGAQVEALGAAGLDAALGGSVSVALRPDRLVVSVRDIPSAAAGAADSAAARQAPSSFQVELFTAAGHYHAAGTLRMTWLGVGARSGAVRLSAGAGPATGLDLSHQVKSRRLLWQAC